MQQTTLRADRTDFIVTVRVDGGRPWPPPFGRDIARPILFPTKWSIPDIHGRTNVANAVSGLSGTNSES
jgi:hypothetical protein